MIKRNGIFVLILILIIQFISFITSPLCIDGCGGSSLKSLNHTNVIQVSAFIGFTLSLIILITEAIKNRKFLKDIENIIYLAFIIFNLIYFALLINSGNISPIFFIFSKI